MSIGLRLLFLVYNVIISVASLVVLPGLAVWYAVKGRRRAGIRQRFGFFERGFFDLRGPRTVWFHAVSVGETLAAIPLVELLKERNRDVQIYFSTVTETGQAIARERLAFDDRVFYFPFDLPLVTDSIAYRMVPDVFVVVETEIWPNVIRTMNRLHVPVLMVNGRISPRSYKGYMRVRPLIKPVLGLFSHFNMQTRVDAERIESLGAKDGRVSVAGNVKFDHASGKIKSSGADLPSKNSLGIGDSTIVLVGGSTHPGEEEGVIEAFREILKEHPDTVLVIAPRHPERFDKAASILDREGIRYTRKTENKGHRITGGQALLVDTMGELSGLYRVGDIIFVGGSWATIGGHNVLEPAAFGKPVFFGPYMHNFHEIASILKDSGAGIQVKDGRELAKEALRLLEEPDRIEKLGHLAKDTLRANRGALLNNVELIEKYL